MSRIAKPKLKVVDAAWAWKPDNIDESVKLTRGVLRANLTDARRNALHLLKKKHRHVFEKPLPPLSELGIAMHWYGYFPKKPVGKAQAKEMLVIWYKNCVPKDQRIKKQPKGQYHKDRRKFYDSREWKQLRYKALTTQGRQCQCCGATPPNVVLHVDHIKPRSLYPELELDIDNLQILCEACNIGKSNHDDTDFR